MGQGPHTDLTTKSICNDQISAFLAKEKEFENIF